MEGAIVMQNRGPILGPVYRRFYRSNKTPIRFVLTSPIDEVEKISCTKTNYKDSWFNHVAINHLSQAVQSTTGFRNTKSGYESLVEAARAVSRNYGPTEQRDLVIKALDKAFPKPILAMIRTLLPNSKFTREYFAVFTTVFFTWLIGPSEVRESKLNGVKEKNVVHINKCRLRQELTRFRIFRWTNSIREPSDYIFKCTLKFLEESNCVGMCTNLCKMSSQTFIKDSFGIPVNMVPNFEDMSCEMIYGQDPPTMAEDPAFKQPCYELCKAKKSHKIPCPD